MQCNELNEQLLNYFSPKNCSKREVIRGFAYLFFPQNISLIFERVYGPNFEQGRM